MDRILNRICSINNHPISFLDIRFREKYIKGLGACLYELSNNSPIVYMYFKAWSESILKKQIETNKIWRKDINAIKTAISIQRKGFRFFSMKYPFFYDVFYLIQNAQKEGYDSSISNEIMIFFKTKVCGMFTKNAMTKIYNLFQFDTSCPNIPCSLIQHKYTNDKFLQSKETRILVVANVSAGKSTLINALVGYRLNKTRTTACTSKLSYLHNKQANDGITLYTSNKQYTYFNDIESTNSDAFTNAAFPFNSTMSNTNICLIDTPGINNVNDIEHRKITENAIKSENFNAVIYVSNCQYFGTNDEHALLLTLKKTVKTPIIFVLNQLDHFKQKEDSITKMINDYADDLHNIGFKSPIICPLSAQAALLFKLPDDKLDEDDKEDKEIMKKKFCKDYYDLPSYIVNKKTQDLLEKTGITYLENQILNIN